MRVTPALPAVLALLAGTGLGASALAQGAPAAVPAQAAPAQTAPAQAAPAGSGPAPLVSAVPANGSASGSGMPPVVSTIAQPAPGTGGGTSLPVGKDGPVTAGMVFGGPQPLSGHNSFTRDQAARRIAQAGFSGVSGLRKDARGVWRGTAQHGGASASVWLDFRGRVGAS